MAQTKEEHMAQIDAWQKENITRVTVKFSKKSERDQKILAHLRKQESMQKYIKDALEEKIER